MKKILMISRLNIWYVGEKYQKKTAGNQTMYNTIKGYSDNGFSVWLLSSGVDDKTDLGLPNVKIIRSKFAAITTLKNRLIACSQKKQTTQTHRDFDVGSDHKPYSNLKMMKLWGIFAAVEASIINLKYHADAFYGYEFSGVLPAYYLSKVFKKPLITRYQGTRLGFFLNNDKQFYACEDTIYSMRLPADLVIIGDDGTQGDLVCEKLGLSLDNVRLWINGVDNINYLKSLQKDRDFKGKLGIPEDAIIISSSNRFDFWKRIDRLIYTFSMISKQCPEVYFIVVGDGPNRRYIEDYARELGIFDRIVFCGALDHNLAINVIRNSDIYMTLCDYTNLSNSILEAQVMSIPVITLDVGGIKKIISDGYNGFLFSVDDIDLIPKKVRELIDEKALYSSISEAERVVCSEKIMSWEDRMKMEIAEVNKLLND